MVTDTAGADKPIGVFTGDFLFVGDIGRPDLLEEAAGFKGTKEPGRANSLRACNALKRCTIISNLASAQRGQRLWQSPGRCALTTLGYEKLFNPAFKFVEEESICALAIGRATGSTLVFCQMKMVNKVGPVLLRELPQPVQSSAPT